MGGRGEDRTGLKVPFLRELGKRSYFTCCCACCAFGIVRAVVATVGQRRPTEWEQLGSAGEDSRAQSRPESSPRIFDLVELELRLAWVGHPFVNHIRYTGVRGTP